MASHSVHACVHVCARGGQRLMLDTFWGCLSLYPELSSLAGSAGQQLQGPLVHTSPALGGTHCHTKPFMWMWISDLEGILPTKLSFQTPGFLFEGKWGGTAHQLRGFGDGHPRSKAVHIFSIFNFSCNFLPSLPGSLTSCLQFLCWNLSVQIIYHRFPQIHLILSLFSIWMQWEFSKDILSFPGLWWHMLCFSLPRMILFSHLLKCAL